MICFFGKINGYRAVSELVFIRMELFFNHYIIIFKVVLLIFFPLYHLFLLNILIIRSHKLHCFNNSEMITWKRGVSELFLIWLIKYLWYVNHHTIHVFLFFHLYLSHLFIFSSGNIYCLINFCNDQGKQSVKCICFNIGGVFNILISNKPLLQV